MLRPYSAAVNDRRRDGYEQVNRARRLSPGQVTPVGDRGMRLTTQATVNRHDFGVDGNLIGMIGDSATISGDVVFRRTST